MIPEMKRFPLFVLAGLLTAAVGEWQFSVFLRGDTANFYGSLVFNALYLTTLYIPARALLPVLRRRRGAVLLYSAAAGLCGLAVEWFLIGNSPWGNPDASQAGMFAYWACMALVPLMVLLRARRVQRFILYYGLAYTAAAAAGQLLIQSPGARLAFHILLFIAGYIGLLLGMLWVYEKNLREIPPAAGT